MALLTALFAIGTALRVQGQAEADTAQANALDVNASFFREQADFIKKAGLREFAIFKRKGAHLVSSQIESYARSAVEFSGSAVRVVAEQEQLLSQEAQAIRFENEHKVRITNLRAVEAHKQAQDIRDTTGKRQFATLLSSGTQFASSFGGK